MCISGSGDTQEYKHRPVDPSHVGDGEGADPPAQVLPADSGDLVDHDIAVFVETVLRTGRKQEAKQRGIGRIAGQGADGHGTCGLETVVLHDDDRAGLAGIVAAARRDPQFAPLYPASISLMASIKA